MSLYLPASRKFHSISPEGREVVSELDAQGRVVKREVAGLEPTKMSYDAQGRVRSVVVGTGDNARRTTFGYRADGYLGTVTGPDNEQRVLTPDGAGRITDVERSDGKHVQVSYDGRGRLKTVTPPDKPAHGLRYTPVGLTAQYDAPGLGSDVQPMMQATYNRDRKLDLVSRADGRVIDPVYDAQNGRLAQLLSSSASSEYGYKASGQLESVMRTDVLGMHGLSSDYDGALPTVETWSGDAGLVSGSIERVSDAHFRLDKLKLNGDVVVDYGYDQDNLVTSAGPMMIARRPDNGIIANTTLGQMTTLQTVTTFGELDDISARYAGSLLYDEDITERDKLGRIVLRTDRANDGGSLNTSNYEYQYDDAARLTDVFVNGDQVSHYDYDANGNRVGMVNGVAQVVGQYDNQDRLTRYCPEDASGSAQPMPGAPCFTYTYRATGELETRTELLLGQTTHYAYDEFGALQSVQLSDGRSIAYEIDAAGRRVGKYIDGVKQWGLLYQSGLQPIAQLDADNNVMSVFVYGTRPNVPDYMTREGVTYRFVTDHLGSVRMVVNTATGDVAEQVDYDEFGVIVADTNPGFQPFGFAGGLYDADTGLTRFGARDYDPVLGRWTAKDPILFGGGDTNLYAYVGNDPINFIDPSGTDAWSAAGAFALGAGGAVVGGVAFAGLAATGTVVGGLAAVAIVGYGAYSLAMGLNDVINGTDTEARIDAAAGLAGGLAGGGLTGRGLRGIEFEVPWLLGRGPTGKPGRIAPWGNRTGNEWGEFPHYHRAICDPNKPGQSLPGQGMGNHRPYEGGW